MTKEGLKEIIESSYNRVNWVTLIREVFNNGRFNVLPIDITSTLSKNDIAEKAYELGSFQTVDERIIGIYEIKINEDVNLERNRVALRQLLHSVYKEVDGAFIVFDQGKQWRFSFVSEISLRDVNDQLVKSQTEPKRFTYLFGEGINNRTAIERFNKLINKPVSLEEIKEAFSVDSLTKEFYRELSDWYFWALQHVEFPDDEEKDKDVRNSTNTIRLITRIMFVWFLKQKGLIPDELFDKDEVEKIIRNSDKKDSTYYKAILQNLFFATLNTEMGDSNRKFVDRQYGVQGYYRYKRFFKDADKFLEITKNVPFLNGGLFENLDKNVGTKEEKRIDCFSNRLENEIRVAVPDYLFFGYDTVDLSQVYDDKKRDNVKVHGLLNILKKYNFTIEENTPLDIEVALDPELLGKVFENLLASYNPETKSTARKQTGSFYTPREIVDYMVDESLKAFLLQKLLGNHTAFVELGQQQSNMFGSEGKKGQLQMEEAVKKSETEKLRYEKLLDELLSYSEVKHRFNVVEVDLLIKALDGCKIIDPACGSGAYPMGILHKMVHVLHKLDENNERWKERQLQRVKIAREAAMQIEDTLVKENLLNEYEKTEISIKKAFENNELDYGRKLYLIENCIYGSDIQPIAVQIAKLRFFISLVVDQNPRQGEDNLGIKPLPNLETKFVAANSLISVDKGHGNLFERDIKNKERELKQVRENHFSAPTPYYKRKYREQDAVLRKELLTLFQETGVKKDASHLLANWNPYDQNASAPFFDSEWMFGLEEGFDIVIGNPPYVSLQKIDDTKKLKAENFKTFESTGDLYSLFYERGNILLRDKGILCYITSNKWINANYGKSTRRYFASSTNPLILIDFGKVRIFESATVFVNILILQKGQNENKLRACTIQGDQLPEITLRQYFDTHSFLLENIDENIWKVNNAITVNINSYIEAKGTKLKDWKDISFFAGIKSGLNEAYHISEAEKNELILKNSKNANVIKPFLRGKDIKRWRYAYEGWHMLFIPWHFPLHNDPSIINSSTKAENAFKSEYPDIYAHLLKYKNELSERNQTETGVRYEWYALQRYGADFWQNFELPKIVWIEISDKGNYAYDETGMYLTNSAYFMSGKHLKYILAILNSKVADYYFFQITATIAGGRKRYTKQYVEQIPVPKISEEAQQPFIKMVDYILFLQKFPDSQEARVASSYFETVLNAMVYELYFDELVKESGREVIKYIEKIPSLTSDNKVEGKVNAVFKIYEEIYKKEHPIRNNVFFIDSIPEIKEINQAFLELK